MDKTCAVIGVGNPFRGDDGIGVFLLYELQKKNPILQDNVEFIDGGTGGMNIFHLLGSYETVIIIDAVDFDASAGDFIFFAAKEIKESKKLPSSISTHGFDVFSVIKNVEKYSDRSPRIFIFGVQPKQITLSQGFSEEVQKKIPVYVDLLIQRIKEHMG